MKRGFLLLVTGVRSMRAALLFCMFASFLGTLALAQTNPVPFVNQPLVPMTVAPGGPSFTLTVNGTGFVSGSVVKWNGGALQTTFINHSQLTASVPASEIATPSTASVTVTNPAPGGGVSNLVNLQIANQAASLTFSDFYSGLAGDWSLLLAGDFNNDGKLDVATAGAYINTDAATVALGNGDGTFQLPQYADFYSGMAVFAADFNGDGKLDLAVIDASQTGVSILLGNGDGTFQPAKAFTTNAGAWAAAAGDFNGDGKLDLAVVCVGSPAASGSISILLGNGDGTFQSSVDYIPPGSGLQRPLAMTLGDFNGDGKLDIALFDVNNPDQSGLFFVLFGNGDGTFQFSTGVPETVEVFPTVAADVNGDGKLDLVGSIWSTSSSGTMVMIGNGDGTFQPFVLYPTGSGAGVGDFNADGKLDIVGADTTGIAVLFGNGDGTFQPAMTFPIVAPDCPTGAMCFPMDVAVGDFNGDGETDVAVTIANNLNNVLVLLQGNWPALTAVPPSTDFGQQNVGSSTTPTAITLMNTGFADLVVTSIGITGTNAGDFSQNNNCVSTLVPNTSCQVNGTFTPSLPGLRNATISVTTNSLHHPIVVPLSGTGNGALASLSPQTVTFPNQYVGTSGLPQSVTVNNTGNAPLTITSVAVTPTDFATLNACGNTLAAGSSCSIGVFFDPTASGTRSGSLTLTDNAGRSPQIVTLSGTGQDFSLASSGSTSVTISPGQTANYTITVSSGGGFNQTVAFSCSGAPTQSTCSVTPNSVTLNGSSSTSVNVIVTTVGSSARLSYPSDFFSSTGARVAVWLPMCGLPGLALMGILGTHRRRLRGRTLMWLLLFGLLFVGLSMSGCGGSGSHVTGGPPPGTYNLSVTGSFKTGTTSLTHATQLTLVVQ